MAKNHKGSMWVNNGIEEHLIKPGTHLEGEGWVAGRLDSSKEKWLESEHNSPNHFYKSDIKNWSPRIKPRKKRR